MDLNGYQKKALETAIFSPEDGIMYTTLGLVSESGEIAGKVKKIIRDKDWHFAEAEIEAIADELGDVLWYCAALADALGKSLDEVAMRNLSKLADRKARGVIKGSGDNR